MLNFLLTYFSGNKVTPQRICHAHYNLSRNKLRQHVIQWYNLLWSFKLNNFGTSRTASAIFYQRTIIVILVVFCAVYDAVALQCAKAADLSHLAVIDASAGDDFCDCEFIHDIYNAEIHRHDAILSSFTSQTKLRYTVNWYRCSRSFKVVDIDTNRMQLNSNLSRIFHRFRDIAIAS